MKRISVVFLAILMIAVSINVRFVSGQEIEKFVPNDPKWDMNWANILRVSEGLAKLKQLEVVGPVIMPTAVVVVFDTEIYDHPDLAANRLNGYDENFTDEPQWGPVIDRHGSGPASIIAAGTDNKMGPPSIGGLTNRILFISFKTLRAGSQTGESIWIKRATERVIQLKDAGVPIVAISISTFDATVDASWDAVFDQLDSREIVAFVAAETSDSPFDLDLRNDLLSTVSRRHRNVFTVQGLESDGRNKLLTGCYGRQSVSFFGPGMNVKIVSYLSPTEGASNMSGSSAATPHGTAVYGLIRVYKEADFDRSLERLKQSAVMIPGLEQYGKYGKLDLYNAMNMELVEEPPPPPPPTIAISEATWTAPKLLVLKGHGFGPDIAGSTIVINGVELSNEYVRSANSTTIKVRGKMKFLKLTSGTNRVVVKNNITGDISAEFELEIP